MALSAGDLVGGRYGLEEVIGSGGMGDVWRARDRVLGRAVALKLVYAGDPRRRAELSRDFLREARISAAIGHRNVVQILDFGAHNDDVPYMVMELLEGETLAHVLGRSDPVSFDWILAVITQALEGLAAAHDAGVIHRDVKPENIFLVREREGVHPKLLDFGISKVLESDGSDALLSTRGDRLLGTPAYMSPEQARGLRNLDKRTDVYSIGVVLYELLSGSMPFFSENPGDLLLMIVNEDAPPLCAVVPDVGQPLSDVVSRAMSKNVAERYPDARAMREALLEIAEGMLGSDGARRLGVRVRPASWRKGSSQRPDAEVTNSMVRASHRLHDDATTAELTSIVGAGGNTHKYRKWWIAAAAAVGLLVVGATAISWERSNAAPAPRFIVVSADRSADETEAEAPGQAVLPDPDNTPVPAEPTPNSRNPPATKPSGAALAAQALAQSFRAQKAGVVKCVNEHERELGQTPQLAVHLSLDAEGKVSDADVSPAELGSSAVGTCIEQAVRAMQFPSQGAPISFQVPLTTKRGG